MQKVKIDYGKDDLLADYAVGMLKDFYLIDGETSPQDAFKRASEAWSTYKGTMDEALAQRLYDAVSKKHFNFASPVLSNAPKAGEKSKGMPISCFLTYVPDTVEGLIDHTSELRWLSIMGGGVGGHWEDVRTVSNKAPGPIPFLHTVDADMTAYKQGKTRKGSYAAYLDVSHPEIIEFINLRVPTGDVQRKALNLHNAVNIPDGFMEAVIAGKDWELRDPADNSVKEVVNAAKLFERIIEIRNRTGEPYLNFIDTANRALPETQKEMGLKIHGSNLCNEIHLATDENRTAVCCLSSLNLEFYEDWKDTTLVEDLITMLDNVIEYFVENAPDTISRAKFSAMRERSVGLGAMGFHYLLQSKGLPWESEAARELNNEVFELIKSRAVAQSIRLGSERGEAPDMAGTGRRNAHLLAIAPNASSAIILSTSPSIEPAKANAYTHRTRAGSFLVKNPYLERVLEQHGRNDANTWSSIITNKGSVAHLSFLSPLEKDVYKTADEINQTWVVKHAADRQKYICQGQSVNLFFKAGAERTYVIGVHALAWKLGLKGLYYLRTEAKSQAENVSEKIERNALEDYKGSIVYGTNTCPFCEQAKQELEMRGIPYEFVNLKEIGKTAKEVTGRDVKTVPQIYLDGNYVGGYDDLMVALDAADKLNYDNSSDECRSCEG